MLLKELQPAELLRLFPITVTAERIKKTSREYLLPLVWWLICSPSPALIGFLTVDLHAPQIQGFFNIPVDELTALNVLANYFIEKKLNGNLVVVATDIGISKRARDLAEKLNVPLAIMEKRRVGNADRTETLNVIGDVEGKMALTLDDEIDTAGSLVNVVNTLIERGVKGVYSCCTHPVFSGPAIQRIAGLSG